MHAGIPHISMDFPEYKRINEDIEVAVLISELSVQKIKDAILKLTSNKTYYKQLKSNCELAKENYHWAKEEEKLVSIYKKLLESHP
jgi:glycosyltransferase involved in cell wall biosynthesis